MESIKTFARTFKSLTGITDRVAHFRNKKDALAFAESVDWCIWENFTIGGYSCGSFSNFDNYS